MDHAVLDAASAHDLTREVFEVYAHVFGADGGFEDWRQSPWGRHRSRPDFRLATVRDGDRLVGFGWGYTGHRGEYWPDLVAEALPGLDAWVGGHFELVELAVLPEWRGRGAGRRLHDLLLEGLPHDRALLSTAADPEDPAVRLYRSRGWRCLGLLGLDRQVMGLRLDRGRATGRRRTR
ncbi:GNAT family N-acetyltransferase [Nocardioides sp. MAHUQ-72]|uniref:GNAT family N-acetyltransferase n=1 Tax=unclassified Nocardioides TaxID=2615069 RepID=UPI00360860C8